MKFRCTGNSIRLRVRKSDLQTLRLLREIREEVPFAPGQALSIVLVLGEGERLRAGFTAGEIRVEVPSAMAIAWIESAEVGIEALQETGATAGPLHIKIEKDFPCRHTTESNREDTFYELAPEDPTAC